MEITFALLMGITIGITEAIKKLNINKQIIPFVAMNIGILVMFIGGELINIVGWREKIILGLFLGLSAMGLYSGVKATIGE